MKSNTLPISVSQIQLWFVSSAMATQAPMHQAQLDGIVTCVAATPTSQPVPSSSTSSFAGKPTSPAICRSPFESKCATPSVCLAALRSQMNQLLNSSTVQSHTAPLSTPVNTFRSNAQHTKSLPVPMSATPPPTCIRPKVLAPTPQISETCTSSAAGIRPLRPNQPLPPVRTSSCPTKVIPVPKQPDEVYEQVPMHEPDLSRQPSRSALKGSKSTGAQSFQQQLEKALSLTQKLAGCHPFPADATSDAVVGSGLSRSRSGDCAKPATKSLPAVPPKPRLM